MKAPHAILIAAAPIALIGLMTLPGLVAQQAELYVGAERCAACHPYQYRVWKASPHARTSANLTHEQRQDRRCAQCHMTLVPMKPGAKTIADITCEQCHGAGKYYQHEFVMADQELRELVGLRQPAKESCASCHNEAAPSLRGFDYPIHFSRIDHREPPKAP